MSDQDSPRRLRMNGERLIYVVLALGILVTLGFMIATGEPAKRLWWGKIAPLALWTIGPFWMVFLATRQRGDSSTALGVLIFTSFFLTAQAVGSLCFLLLIKKEDDARLVFSVMPVYEFLCIVPLLAIALWHARKGRA